MEDNPHISELAIKQLNRTHSLVCCIIILILGESCPIYIYIRPIQKKKTQAFWNDLLLYLTTPPMGLFRVNKTK